jgi:hypothetical protein
MSPGVIARCRPSFYFAGTRERVGTRRGRGPRSHAASLMEIGFAPEMIANSAIMPHVYFMSANRKGGRQHDRVSDIARADRPGRHRGSGGIFMRGEITRLILRPHPDRGQTDFPTIAFRSAARPDDLTMERADAGSGEYMRPSDPRRGPEATEQLQKPAVDGGESRADEAEARVMPGFEMLAQSKRTHDNRADGNQESDQQ